MGRADVSEVLRIVNDYRRGSCTADEVLLRSVFHESAGIHGYLGSELSGGSAGTHIKELVACATTHAATHATTHATAHATTHVADPFRQLKNDSRKLVIESIFVQGNIASVVASEKGSMGEPKLINCFHLIKDDGIWSIVSLIFSTC